MSVSHRSRWMVILAGGLLALGLACAPASGPRFVIQSHRGAGTLAPENTLDAFELAWQLGTVPEADVRTTKDRVIVAFHDKTFKRLVKDATPEQAGQGVHDLVWDDLSKLDVGAYKGEAFAGQRIPRMSDVFAIMRGRPGRWLYLDIKDVTLERLAELVRQYGVQRQVILASTHYPLICTWRELLADGRTLLWMGGSESELAERLNELREADFKGITQLQIHVKVGDLKAADPFTPSSAFLRSVGIELGRYGIVFQTLPWDTPEPAVYHRLMDLGVQSFATDAPRVTLEAVRTYHREERK